MKPVIVLLHTQYNILKRIGKSENISERLIYK